MDLLGVQPLGPSLVPSDTPNGAFKTATPPTCIGRLLGAREDHSDLLELSPASWGLTEVAGSQRTSLHFHMFCQVCDHRDVRLWELESSGVFCEAPFRSHQMGRVTVRLGEGAPESSGNVFFLKPTAWPLRALLLGLQHSGEARSLWCRGGRGRCPPHHLRASEMHRMSKRACGLSRCDFHGRPSPPRPLDKD